MSDGNSDGVLLSRICSACCHINETNSSYCLQCGAPIGHFPELARADDTEVARPSWRVYGVTTEMVGRKAELAAVRRHIDEAIKRERASVVVMRAPEGYGKSRLLDALDRTLEVEGGGVLVVRSDQEHDTQAPYSVFDHLLRARFYIMANGSKGHARDMLEQGVRALVGEETGTEITHRVGALVGLTFPDSPWVREDSLEEAEVANRRALVRLLRVDATRNPLVMVIDDIDRAGAESRMLIGHLMQALTDVPIVFLLTAGPECKASDLGLVDESTFHAVDLAALSDDEISELTSQLLQRVGKVPDGIVRRLTERAFGNPLTAEQLVRILIAQDVIDTRGDVWTLDAAKFEKTQLPEALEDVVRARLDGLSTQERYFLERAALMGNSFYFSALLALYRGHDNVLEPWSDEDEEHRLRQRLDALLARDLIVPVRHPGLAHEDEFRFKHGVERRLLADGVDASRRPEIFRRLANWLQLRVADNREQYLVRIAEFLEEGQLSDRAGHYYWEAGAHAKRHYINDRARRYFDKSLDLLGPDSGSTRLDVLHDLGSVLSLVGDHQSAIPIFEELARLSWQLAARSKGGVAYNKLGRAYQAMSDYDRALEYLNKSFALFESVEDEAGISSTLDNIGKIHWIRGDYDQAQKNYQRALDIRRKLNDTRSIALSLNNMGTLLVHRGQFKTALSHFREALALRKGLHDLVGIAESLNTIGVIFMERGDAESAHRLWTEALDVARESGDRFMQGILHNNIGEVEVTLGQLEDAGRHLKAAIQISDECGDRRLTFDAVRNVGVLEGRKGNHKLAVDNVEEALEMARSLGSLVMEGVALRTLAELHGKTLFDTSYQGEDGADSDAEKTFRSSIAIFKNLGNESELGRSYHAYGTYLLEQGLLVQGKKHLEMAKDIFERLEMRRILAQTEETIGNL